MVSDSGRDIRLEGDEGYHLNPECSVCVSYVGKENSPVIIIDNLWHNPEKLVALAADKEAEKSAEGGGFEFDPKDYYPGLRKPLAPVALSIFEEEIAILLNQHMHGNKKNINVGFASFSLTNVPAKQLAPIQCIPHFDTTDMTEFAMVCYLFKQPLGGTSFYCHRKTGFETIDERRKAEYMQTLQTQATTEGLPSAEYISGDTNLFEQIHNIPAWYNRAILYPANLLHSGDIQGESVLSDDPTKGRLTLNFCIGINA